MINASHTKLLTCLCAVLATSAASAYDLNDTWQLSTAKRTHDISSWGKNCGSEPKAFHGEPRAVTVHHSGADKDEQIMIPDLQLFSDTCFRSPYSRVVRQDHLSLHCASPTGTMPEVAASYAFMLNGPESLRFHGQISRRWTLKEDTCAYTTTLTYEFERSSILHAPAPSPSSRHNLVGYISLAVIAMFSGGMFAHYLMKRHHHKTLKRPEQVNLTIPPQSVLFSAHEQDDTMPNMLSPLNDAFQSEVTRLPMSCPQCEAIYAPEHIYCTADGTLLDPDHDNSNFTLDAPLNECSSCLRKYPADLERCPHDFTKLSLSDTAVEAEQCTSGEQRHKICPECSATFDDSAQFCDQDGHELLGIH